MNTLLKKCVPAIVSVMLLAGCGGGHRFVAPTPPPDDRKPVPAPQSREINLAADNVAKIGTSQIKRLFDLSGHFRSIFNRPIQALNTDAFDEVFESSWFTNRNGRREMSLAEIARGPDRGSGPDLEGVWTIVRAKSQGVTPGFTIRDSHGDLYVIKFDPAGYPGLSTGAELVSTKLFYAIGYNVPENYLVCFDPAMLRMGQQVKLTDSDGKKRFMNAADLEEILERIQTQPDGMIRAVASKFLSGKPMGSFYYEDLRKDDLNDVIPHQHRRELRGLRWIAAWLNHYDTKANNSLDMFDPAGYVKHYLIDFGSTLGSQGDEPMPPEIGHEGIIDPPQVAKLLGTLGAYIRPWERETEARYPSVGYFISEDFKPKKYKFILPNPAFASATTRDSFWGAKLVMSFSDAQIRTAVAQGQYSDPAAAEYLTRIIIERRDIIGRYWFTRVPPLDHFELHDTGANHQTLRFLDLGIKTGLAKAEVTTYHCEIYYNDQLVRKEAQTGSSQVEFSLKPFIDTARDHTGAQWAFVLRLNRDGRQWTRAVTVFAGWDIDTGTFVLSGLEREE